MKTCPKSKIYHIVKKKDEKKPIFTLINQKNDSSKKNQINLTRPATKDKQDRLEKEEYGQDKREMDSETLKERLKAPSGCRKEP